MAEPTTTPPDPHALLTREEAARELRCSVRTLRRLIASGEVAEAFPPHGPQAGLIERAEVQDYRQRCRVAARRVATHRKRSEAATAKHRRS